MMIVACDKVHRDKYVAHGFEITYYIQKKEIRNITIVRLITLYQLYLKLETLYFGRYFRH